MKFEYDSRKNCASQMKSTHNFFSAAHFAKPLPTVNCNLSPVTCIHTFSAKEKDSETGLSCFGSRYYSSDLSIWLSVDPMADKYPSISPYTYCANNPVKLGRGKMFGLLFTVPAILIHNLVVKITMSVLVLKKTQKHILNKLNQIRILIQTRTRLF